MRITTRHCLVYWASIGFVLSCLLGCDQQQTLAANDTVLGQITAERLINIDREPGSWMTGGRDYQQSYYSPLNEIDKNNVQQLGFA